MTTVGDSSTYSDDDGGDDVDESDLDFSDGLCNQLLCATCTGDITE